VTVTLGHVLMVLAVIAGVAAILYASTAMRNSGHGRGTPQYARARMARRSAFYALGLALFFAALCITPLCRVALVGGAA